MNNHKISTGYNETKQEQYEQEIHERYGDQVFEGVKDWNDYTPEQKTRIKTEGDAIYTTFVTNMEKGHDSPEIQTNIAAWHQHLRYFYDPSNERLLGLAELYNEHPDFIANFRAMHSDFPEFLRKAIQFYVQMKTKK
jgi:hypothetical protein